MKTAVLAALIAFPVLADPDVSIRSRAPDIDVNELADKVGEIAARTLRETSDIDVTGEVVRVQEGFRVTLELRENGKLGATASAAASTPEEVIDASASAAVDLFRAWKETSALSMNPSPVPEPPGPSAALQPGIVKLDLDADLMVAFDEARTADAQGTDKPEDAAAAWRAVAESIGPNPFREAAAERAKAWQTWAENKRAFEEQRSKDTSRMRKVLPLEAVTDETKIELLVRYTRAYGVDRAGALISFMPSPLRLRGNLAVGCEAQQARKCVELASMSTDPARAADYLGQACNAGDANACADAGERWLSEDTRDVSKALSALESGCAGGSARACTRLARVYEEGDGTDVDLARASEIRDRACSAGDGLSCRKLACNAADAQAANELWSKGCKDGDSVSCTLANATKPQPAPVPVQPETKPVRRPGAGSALLGFAVVAGTGAAFLALTEQGDNNERAYWRPHALTMAGGGTRSAASSPRILPIALGATAAVAAVAGVTLLVWQPDPGPGKVAVGVTPTGLMLSGNLP
jgi:TPR repeat protein